MFGRPAAGVPLRLLREADASWAEQSKVYTDENGCAASLATPTQRSRYRLVLSLDQYFAGLGVEPFQSRIDITFRVFHAGERVRLLLVVTPSACATYRLAVGRA